MQWLARAVRTATTLALVCACAAAAAADHPTPKDGEAVLKDFRPFTYPLEIELQNLVAV